MPTFNGIYAPDQPLRLAPRQTLGDMLIEISAAQRQRKMDELRLKEAQMSLAEKKRKEANELAMQQALAAPTLPEPSAGGFNPMGLIPEVPEMQPASNVGLIQQYAQRLMRLGKVDEASRLLSVIPKMTPRAPTGLTAEDRMAVDANRYDLIMQAKRMDIEAAAKRVQQTAQYRNLSREDAQAHDIALAELRGAISRYNTPSRMIEGEEGYVGADPFARGPINRAGGSMLPGVQPGAPVPAGAVPLTMPPNVNTPNPSNMGSDAPPPPPTDAEIADANAKFLGGGTGTGSVSPDMAPAPTSPSTTPLYGEQLRGPVKAPSGGASPKDLENIRLKWQSDPIVQSLEKNNMANARLEGVAQSFERSLAAGQSPAMEQLTILYNFIQNLDNSVVKAGELDLFKQNAATIWQNLNNALGRYGPDDTNVRAMTVEATQKLLAIRREMNNFLNQFADQYAQRFESNFAPRYREQGLVASGAPLVPAPYSAPVGKKSYKRVINGVEVMVEED